MLTLTLRQFFSWLIVLFSVTLFVLVVVLVTPSSVPAVPVISWNPSYVADQIGTGQIKTIVVSFTSSEAAKDILVRVVPELQPFVQVNPSSILSIAKGQTANIKVTFSATKQSPIGAYRGTIQLRTKGVLAKPLPVTIDVCRCVTAHGLSLKYPPDWETNGKLLAVGGPINLNTFGGAYHSGGIVPTGGAEISIGATPLQGTSISKIRSRDAIDSTVQAESPITVADSVGTRVEYLVPFGPRSTYSNVIIYLPRDTMLYKFSLLYHTGDPLEADFLADFAQIISTVNFTP